MLTRTKRAFTMAEAVLVMMILGIIATIMITTLKPTEYRDKALVVLSKKILGQIDTATTQILVNNTREGKFDKLLLNQGKGEASFSYAENGANVKKLYQMYLVAIRKDTKGVKCKYSTSGDDANAFFLKDGSYMAIITGKNSSLNTIFPGETVEKTSTVGLGAIYFDVNGEDEPNLRGKDQFVIPIGAEGIQYDLTGTDVAVK